jgi:hypothetical protein
MTPTACDREHTPYGYLCRDSGLVQPSAEADPAYAFFLETVEELSKVRSGSTAVGSRAA